MTAVAIGIDPLAEKKIVLDKAARDTHLHVIGASGTGKSYFLEHMLKRTITNGAGVCFIDPHGETYNNLVAWLATSGIRPKGLHLINPSRSESSVGFNPLCSGNADPSRRVADMLEAFTRVWGGTDTDGTPRLEKCLRNTLYPLAVHRLSLLEANIFTSLRYKELRERLTADLPIWEYSDEWAEFNAYSNKEFREFFESTRTRLFRFVTSPAIRPIIGQTENVLNFRECMDEGHVVLVNLAQSPSFHKREAQLLGAMLIADLYSSAMQRDVPTAGRNPFYAVIDECASYLNEDIANSLDETRKYGLHFTLSHQRLGQLRELGDNVCDAVMTNAQSKVVFRVDEDDNAEVLCRTMLRSEFDLEIPKESLNKPVATGQEIIELYSMSESDGTAYGKTSGTSSSEGQSTGHSVFIPEVGDGSGHTETAGTSAATANNSGSSWAETRSTTRGKSESLRTKYEIMPTAVYSLPEVIHFGTRTIRELPNRTALVRLAGGKPTQVYTLDVKNRAPLKRQLERFTARMENASRFTHPNETVEKEIIARRDGLLGTDSVIEEQEIDGW